METNQKFINENQKKIQKWKQIKGLKWKQTKDSGLKTKGS